MDASGKPASCEHDSPRSSKYQAVLLAGQADGRRVNDGHKPLDVRRQHPIEELLAAVLEAHQEHVSGDRAEKKSEPVSASFPLLLSLKTNESI